MANRLNRKWRKIAEEQASKSKELSSLLETERVEAGYRLFCVNEDASKQLAAHEQSLATIKRQLEEKDLIIAEFQARVRHVMDVAAAAGVV